MLEKMAQIFRRKLLKGCYTVQWRCKLLQCITKSRPKFYFVQSYAKCKNYETRPVRLCNFLSNLSRNVVYNVTGLKCSWQSFEYFYSYCTCKRKKTSTMNMIRIMIVIEVICDNCRVVVMLVIIDRKSVV